MAPEPADVYDQMAESYAESNPSAEAREHYEWPAVREVVPDLEGTRVLDAACGSGQYSGFFAARGADVVGVDASHEMIEQARSRHGNTGEFSVADLREGLPFHADAFDLVVCQLALDHIADWDPVAAEFGRVLEAGGSVVLSLDHPFTTYFVIDHEPPDVGNARAKEADYYQIERFVKDWGDVSMPVYRRPLREVVRPLFAAGFSLTDLREPLPEVDNENLNYFAERTPRFLVVCARLGS